MFLFSRIEPITYSTSLSACVTWTFRTALIGLTYVRVPHCAWTCVLYRTVCSTWTLTCRALRRAPPRPLAGSSTFSHQLAYSIVLARSTTAEPAFRTPDHRAQATIFICPPTPIFFIYTHPHTKQQDRSIDRSISTASPRTSETTTAESPSSSTHPKQRDRSIDQSIDRLSFVCLTTNETKRNETAPKAGSKSMYSY